MLGNIKDLGDFRDDDPVDVLMGVTKEVLDSDFKPPLEYYNRGLMGPEHLLAEELLCHAWLAGYFCTKIKFLEKKIIFL